MKVRDEHKQRTKALFDRRGFARIPAVLITTQPNIFYFTGFTGEDSWAVLTPRRSTIITDGRFNLQARSESPRSRLVIRKGPIVHALAETARKLRLGRIACLDEEVTLALRQRLSSAVKGVRWQGLSVASLLELREVKSPSEIAPIRQALAIAQRSFLDILNALKPGRTERDVAAELEYRMKTLGAEAIAFPTITACGRNSALPHARTTLTRIRPGRPITFDFGARVGGYCCDLTRTVWIGTVSARFREIYGVCLEAQLAAIDAIKAGVTAGEVDAVARNVIKRAGYGRYFVHSLGHGLGLEVHEQPALRTASKTVLTPGMVVTVEPGIYIPEHGGVRIEDDVLVERRGARVLSDLPKALDQVVL